MRRHAVLVALVLAGAARAQWSSSAATNLPVANAIGDQAVPKVSATPDGGSFIAWFDHRGANYDVYLQKLDANGYESWPHNGLLVSAHPQNTSLVDWDLITDSSGAAVLVFTDVRAGGDLDVQAYRIDPGGTFLWGPNGVTLSADVHFEANPVVAEMTDGTFVVAWSRSVTGGNARLVVQRLDVAGVPQFGAAGIEIFGGPNDDPGFVGVVAAPGGAFILSWIRDTTPFAAPRHLHTQKFDAAGAPLWGAAPLAVYDAVSLPIAFRPEMQSDGAGGAWYAWHASVGAFFQGLVQHVSAAGAEVFPHNGVEISLEASRSEFNPTIVQTGGDLIVFYNKRNSGQSLWGIGGQRVSAAGQLLWGASGIEFVPYDAIVEEAPRAVATPTGALCFVEQGNFSTTLIGFSVDTNGATQWTPSILTACSTTSPKDKLRAIAATDGSALLVWSDARTDVNDVYAQNVEISGALGIPPAAVTPYGCAINPPGTLVLVSGTPAIGTAFSLGVDDPAGSMPVGATSVLVAAGLPDPAHPCGTVISGTAMDVPGGPGELLVDLGSLLLPILAGPTWTGPGMPAPFGFTIPYYPPLVGLSAYFQGALFHVPSGRVGLANAVAVRFGP